MTVWAQGGKKKLQKLLLNTWMVIKRDMRKLRKNDYIMDGGGGTENCGLTPTEDVSWLFEEEMLAKRSTSNFPATVLETYSKYT